ncbi:CDP-glycerol glycerophosphotransferase family protein [Mesobacillus subterraneus]|uniref:CDP-glycerol glycerophosphotransferase family protein n=1 Tax=Mesobacillus subterraneus TaxID=285983 RepID=A0A3R9FFI0_9BACI|nr:CDP-glycerol glycerophosphotransferase family protein [Mesobacillus subterraneus]RSD25221.1 CDP-glycerol glycerophosphotransferase family protein [Mesobacillus subterraneus]
MARELAIFLYLRLFSIIFKLVSLVPIQKKVVFVATFPENNSYIYKEMKRQELSCRTVFLSTEKIKGHFNVFKEATVLVFTPRHFLQFIQSVYHLATAKVIVADNYYPFLAVAKFQPDVTCMQIWHANGAIKKFGLEDQSVSMRSKIAQERFKKVYGKFDQVLVGSDSMAEIFQKAFGVPEANIRRTGIPRTDLFFDESKKEYITHKLCSKYPFLRNKKVLLYAPTFRDENLDTFELRINLDQLKQEFEDEYILLLKLHPAIKNGAMLSDNLKGFVYDFSDYPNVNDLLFVTDILITDYSSLPFEFSLLNKPMIFFPYDLTSYEKSRGFWEEYNKLVPGPVAFSTQEIIRSIKEKDFHLYKLHDFNEKWNKYSYGVSSENAVLSIIDSLSKTATEKVNINNKLEKKHQHF